MTQDFKVTVLGSYSGRNAGDAAILFQIAEDFEKEAPNSLLLVPTTHPTFIRSHFNPQRVRPVSVLPWNASIRILGWPLVRCIRQSQLVLITDGILFDVNLFNPLFSFMPGLALAAFLCRRWNIPMVGYNVGAGPFTTALGKKLARYICQSCDHMYVREQDTLNLLEQIGNSPERLFMAADCVFALKGVGEEAGKAILREAAGGDIGPWVGFNVTTYLGTWLKVGIDRATLIRNLAQAADQLLDHLPVRLAWITTQLMDISFAQEVTKTMRAREKTVLITNERLLPKEMISVLSQMELFFGMRLHSLILATAAGTPALGIVYAPKVRSFMKLMDLERYCIELTDFRPDLFCHMAIQAWTERESLRTRAREKRDELAEAALRTPARVATTYLHLSSPSHHAQ